MISIITAFHNEQENLAILHEELSQAMYEINHPYEIIFINDGSLDESGKIADELAEKDSHIHVHHQRKRFGKGEALAAGVRIAKGDIFVFMDADLQDDPQDIKKLIQKLHEGYELVNGVRIGRKHNSIIKAYSHWGNRFLQSLAQSPFTDINCGFKAFKKYVLDDIVIYGNNFRFIPLAAYSKGYKVMEVPVQNRSRKYGQAKFGVGKPIIGFIDTVTAYFLFRFAESPLHFFGIIGGVPLMVGSLIVMFLALEKLFMNIKLSQRPLLQFGILLTILGLQIVMTGIIGELIVYMHKKRKV